MPENAKCPKCGAESYQVENSPNTDYTNFVCYSWIDPKGEFHRAEFTCGRRVRAAKNAAANARIAELEGLLRDAVMTLLMAHCPSLLKRIKAALAEKEAPNA